MLQRLPSWSRFFGYLLNVIAKVWFIFGALYSSRIVRILWSIVDTIDVRQLWKQCALRAAENSVRWWNQNIFNVDPISTKWGRVCEVNQSNTVSKWNLIKSIIKELNDCSVRWKSQNLFPSMRRFVEKSIKLILERLILSVTNWVIFVYFYIKIQGNCFVSKGGTWPSPLWRLYNTKIIIYNHTKLDEIV